MTSDMRRSLREFQDYTEDVERSDFHTFGDALTRLLGVLSVTTPLGVLVSRTLPTGDFDQWYAPLAQSRAGLGGRGALVWPKEIEPRVALQLELLRRVDGGSLDFWRFCHTFLTASGKFDDMVHAFSSHVVRPFARDLVRLLHGQPEFAEPMATSPASTVMSEAPAMHQKFGILRAELQLPIDFAATCESMRPAGVIFFDIDHFKRLNTEYTESIVDRDLLRPFQTFLADFVQDRGFCYSVGGDEFIILLLNSDVRETEEFCQRLRRIVEAMTFKCNGNDVQLTVTLGFANRPSDGEGLDEIRAKANAAENRAKAKGRNLVLSFAEC